MTAPPDDPVDREFRSLARKLQAARGFCFAVFFVDDRRASRQLAARLRAVLGSLGRPLVTLAADTASELVASTMTGLLGAARTPGVDAGRPVFWVEAFREKGDPAWDAQRRSLLMRMNERRSRFESELQAPLVLLLPAGAQRDAATLAPDLWHVRLHSGSLSVAESAESGLATSLAAPGALPEATAPADAPAPSLPREVAYWLSLQGGDGRNDGEAAAPSEASLFDGFAAVNAWSDAGRPDLAAELAQTLVETARARSNRADGAEVLNLLELGAALRESGDALAQAGRLDEAVRVLDEGLAVARGVADAEAADTAKLLASTLFFSLGNALMRSGRATEARRAFEDSLALIRPPPAVADARQARVVAALQTRVGDASVAASDTRAAIAAYAESVALWRHLRESHPSDPSLLRSLAEALVRLGDAEWWAGQGERALTAYRESLALLRDVASLGGDAAAVRPDLEAVQARMAQAEAAPSPADAASVPMAPGAPE